MAIMFTVRGVSLVFTTAPLPQAWRGLGSGLGAFGSLIFLASRAVVQLGIVQRISAPPSGSEVWRPA